MKDLSKIDNNDKKINNYEMNSFNEVEEEIDYLKQYSKNNQKKNKRENENNDKNKTIKEYLLNLTKDNYDGDKDSDDDIYN